MTRDELQSKYDLLTSKVAAMHRAQQEYFAGKKKGYNEPHKLEASKRIEHEVKELVRQLHADSKNPELFIGEDITALNKEYMHFLSRVIYLLGLQTQYFKDTRDRALLNKCKAVEHEIVKLIKAKNDRKPQLLIF